MTIPATNYPIKLRLTTKIQQENDSETFTFDEIGTLTRTGNALYIRYTEHAEDGTTTPVTFKINLAGEISLKRAGQTDTRLRFASNATLPTRYTTPAGTMNLDVRTTHLTSTFEDSPISGDIAIAYALQAGNALLGEYALHLTFNEIR